MGAKEELGTIINKLDELQEEVHAAVTRIIASQIVWTEKSIEIIRKQLLFHEEHEELHKRLTKLEVQILKDCLHETDASSTDRRILMYQSLVEIDANCIKKFKKADAAFDAIKIEWLNPSAEMFDLASMTVKEMRLTVEKWKDSELIAFTWSCTFDALMEHWKQIKEMFEKEIQRSSALAASY